MDLFRDFGHALRREIASQGYDATHVENDDHATAMLYHRLFRYTIPLHPRKILKPAGFECPAQYSSGLQKLEQAIEAGESLVPYSSKSIMSARLRDGLLDYWGIHHFHLGTNIMRDGFVERTDDLLFCRIDDQCAYFITVVAHNPASWTMTELVEIIHVNWPETISSYRLSGVESVSPKVTGDDLKMLRSANVSSFLTMEDGTVYHELQFGNTSGGAHVMDLRWADRVHRISKMIEEQINRDWQTIVADARSQGYSLRDTEPLLLLKTTPDWYWDIMDPESRYWFRRYVAE